MSAAYKSSRHAYEGTETTEVAITRVGGAVDPTGQAQSRKIVSTANAQWLRPFQAEPYAIWNPTTGVDVTVTVCGVSGTGALPNNDDIWLEIEYLGDASSTLGKIVTTTKTNLLAAGAAVASDSSVWSFPATSFDGFSTLVVLSNGNLTVTHNNTTASAGATSTAFRYAGKYYFEVAIQGTTSLGNYCGIVSTAFAGIFGTPTSDSTSVGQGVSTILYSNGGSTGINLGTTAVGDVFCFALDLTARLAWIRRNNGDWNASGTANPATGVGGVPIAPTLGFTPFVRFAGSGGSIIDAMTANFGASAYAFTPPSGFANWDTGWVPFKLETTLTTPRPGLAGYIEARVRVGKPSTTYYLDPKVTLAPASAGTGVAAAYKSSRYAYEGTETTERTITRVDGATAPDGQGQSRKIVTTANAQWLRPFAAEAYAAWNLITGADVVATIYGIINSGALPNNDDIWMEVAYLGATSSALGNIASTTKANLLAANAAVPSDSSAWNGVMLTSFNPFDVDDFTLSNNDLTATAIDRGGVRGRNGYTTGKYYWEVTVRTLVQNNSRFGFCNAAAPLNNIAASPSDLVMIVKSGVVTVNSAPIPGSAAFTAGDVIGIAVDFDGDRIWFRTAPSGIWNSSGTANPATGAGGIDISAVTGALYPGFAVPTSGAGEAITANFGNSAFTGSVPAGFTSGLPGVFTPFKLEKTLSAPRPGLAGYIEARVRVGKASAAYYIDPMVTLSPGAAPGVSDFAILSASRAGIGSAIIVEDHTGKTRIV